MDALNLNKATSGRDSPCNNSNSNITNAGIVGNNDSCDGGINNIAAIPSNSTSPVPTAVANSTASVVTETAAVTATITPPNVNNLDSSPAATITSAAATTAAAAAVSSPTSITVRFNAGEETLDDILQSFHNKSNIGEPQNVAVGGGSISPTVSLKNIAAGGSSGSGGSGGGGVLCGTVLGGGGVDSLSSSPSQHLGFGNDELNLRNNFLQGGFFNRKRSGSIEGASPTAIGPNLIAALSSGGGAIGGVSSGTDNVTSLGTWKLIKGKVTQTIEDIKSSKSSHSQQQQMQQPIHIVTRKPSPTPREQQQQNEADYSDQEQLHTTRSEDLLLETEAATSKVKLSADNSDSDVENEISLEDVSDRSRLRRGLAHIKSRVKAKTATSQPAMSATLSTATTLQPRKDTSPTASTTGSLRSNFLRKRRKQPSDVPQLAAAAGTALTTAPMAMAPEISIQTQPQPSTSKKSKQRGIITAKKDIEIESGVEMLEDMIPTTSLHTANTTAASTPNEATTALQQAAKQPPSTLDLKLDNAVSEPGLTAAKSTTEADCANAVDSGSAKIKKSRLSLYSELSYANILNSSATRLQEATKYMPMAVIFALMLLMILPFHDFLRGIFATLLVITLVEASGTYMEQLFEYLLITQSPEKTVFQIPDYSRMPICEIPAVEEHKTIKTYKGWLNESNSYDPNTFSFTMTRSVYVRLDGTVLKLSGTNARVPKRVMWNEPPIDRARVTFTDHRTYNLLGCRIELLPLGLAKKRYFNRKYPIQLIITTGIDFATSPPSPPPATATTSTAVASTATFSAMSAFTDEDASKPETTKTSFQQGSNALVNGGESAGEEQKEKIDFGSTVLSADLQKLQNIVNPDKELRDITVPCGDEVRLLLFTRSDREKEDWYRRFVAASKGHVLDQDLHLPTVKFVDDADLQAAALKTALNLTKATTSKITPQQRKSKDLDEQPPIISDESTEPKIEKPTSSANADDAQDTQFEDLAEDEDVIEGNLGGDDAYEGLLMSACAARNPPDYVRFMSVYQRACNQSQIPIYKSNNVDKNAAKVSSPHHRRKNRRAKRQEDELWKGINQSLFLGPSGSVVWANVMIGRCLYSCLHDDDMQAKIQDFLQKKLNSIKLPNFMESVNITQIHMGQTPPLVHRVSQPMLDERGTWLDADVTYEGLAHITLTTKLNLLRMKRPKPTNIVQEPTAPVVPILPQTQDGGISSAMSDEVLMVDGLSSVIYDSDAESSGSSSTEEESPLPGAATENAANNDFFQNSPGNARRIFKIVDRIATSNLFQYATELSYVQRAMENMSANITLRVDLKGLVARATLNMPPPPSDRIWMCFRGPPRLWIRAKPTVGDKSVDWSIVTNVIEGKVCEAVNKYLVFPNMVDFTVPFLGKPAYDEDDNN